MSAERTERAVPKLSVRGVSKSFERRRQKPLHVLDQIDLDVRAGEFVCLLGASGCGKSTLLNIVGGFDVPDAGTVEIDGAPVTGPDPRRVFIFQEQGVFPWATVRQNVALGLGARERLERERIVDEYIVKVGLTGFENAYPAELSGGMRQRVALARALAVQPDVVFMDEPLGALDSLTRLQIRMEILRLWKQEGMTILLVTHDVDEAIQLSDRIVVMTPRPGRIAEILDVALPHPRDLGSSEYGRIRNRLYDLLGVSHAV